MIVLDQHHVEKPDAIVGATAASHRVFFQPPQTGCRLARVENLRVSALDGIHELRRQRGNSRKALDEIQRHPLGAEEGAGRAAKLHQRAARSDMLSVGNDLAGFNMG